MFTPSEKYNELIDLYAQMAREGYNRRRGPRVENAYSDQEALKFRHELKALFSEHKISSVIDYGGGGGDWRLKQVPEGGSLAEFLNIDTYRVFEPARGIDNRELSDAAVCFDVMEHIYLADIGYVLDDLFAQARHLIVINVATYPANALLPTGENAHITLRPPQWWKGAVDLVAASHPRVTAALYCSQAYGKVTRLSPICFDTLNTADGYAR